MADVIMPKMGDAMTEGKVLTWHKKVGDQVAAGEPLAEIETDKVNVDIEAEEAGTLLEIVVPDGQSAAVGAKIATIGAAGASPGVTSAGTTPTPAPASPPAAARPDPGCCSRHDRTL